MHLHCKCTSWFVPDYKHTHGPDAWSALCVQMFWLGNPFVRLRPAASFCRLSAADLKQAGAGGRVWTMMSTQTLIAKAELPLPLSYTVATSGHTSQILHENHGWVRLNLALMTTLQRKWGRYLLRSSVRMEASLSSGPLVWAALSALQLRLGTKLEASGAM